MSEPQAVQFDRAEFLSPAPSATACAQCKQPIIQSYYDVSGHMLCSRCHESLTQGGGSSRGRRVLRSFGAGLGAAILGAIVWWGVRTLVHLEVGIISIGIGIGVAKAIRWGTFGRGGRAYQVLAVLLTYVAVALNYTPDVYQDLVSGQDAIKTASITGHLLVLLLAFVLAFAVPFLAGIGNIIGIVIIAFGLFQAWKLTKRTELVVTGPFSVAPAAPPPLPNV
jgi:hypothetical protein